MALSEFKAIETAYVALQALDPAARSRALHWLIDALGVSGPLPGLEAGQKEAELATAPAGPSPVRERAPAAKAQAQRRNGADRRASAVPKPSSARRAPKPTPAEGRAYRRMPAASEVTAAYQQVGTVRGLADHFGVPRHTVQGWARRLRREGYDIGQGA